MDSDVADVHRFVRRLPTFPALLLVPMMRDLWDQEARVFALLASAAGGILVGLLCVSVYRERRALARGK